MAVDPSGDAFDIGAFRGGALAAPPALQDADFSQAAKALGCEVATIRAVAEVESAGSGFLADGRPKILFERHVFHRRTGGRHGALHPAISSAQRGGYEGGAREYARLQRAVVLDRKTALESTSWGKFQIMGFNCVACGHADVERFVLAMVSGEPAQLAAFVAFLRSRGLALALARRDWAAFARGYNGSDFAANGYDRKLAQAYAQFAAAPGHNERPTLKLGDTGLEVARLQRRLGLTPDGAFGPLTKAAVMRFQASQHLAPDGLVGALTWARLFA